MYYFSYFFKKTYDCCRYSLEAPRRVPQNMLLWINKKNISIFGLKKCGLSGDMLFQSLSARA